MIVVDAMCTLTLSVLRARFFGALLGTLLAGSLSGCGGSGNSSSTPAPAPVPLTGKTSFVSADFSSTLSSPYVAFNTATMTTATNAADVAPRTVIEGDIYRVLDAGKTLLNLNLCDTHADCGDSSELSCTITPVDADGCSGWSFTTNTHLKRRC